MVPIQMRKGPSLEVGVSRPKTTITSLVLFGIATILVLGIWASREARMDRSGNFRQMDLAIMNYESSSRLESPSTEQTVNTIEDP